MSVGKKSRREHLQEVKNEHRTMIFYEAPHKLSSTLNDMLDAWGNRRIALVRELTKIHEEVIRTTLSEAAARYADGGAKGEFVLVIEGAPVEEKSEYTLEEAVSLAKELVQSGLSASDAAKQAAQETGFKKGELYKALLNG